MSDRGSSLDDFIDFALSTRQKLVSDPGKLYSQALNYRTFWAPLILRGQKEMLQGGTELTDIMQLDYSDRFSWRNFNDTYSFVGSDTLKKFTAPWRVFTVDEVVHEAELDLQQGGEEVVFKKVKEAKLANMEASFWEGLERSLWATPNFETMESATLSGTGQMQSLLNFITTDGLMPSTTNGGVASSNFTTLQGVSSSETKWRNQVETFDNTSDATRRSESRTGLIPAMDRMWLKVKFESPDSFQKYQENTALSKLRIACNLESLALMTSIARSKNNVLTPVTDLGSGNGKIGYHGIAIEYVSRLDNIDTDVANNPGDAPTAQDGASKKGYRYRFINLNHFKIYGHSKHFRRLQDLKGGVTQPNTRVMLEDTWLNLWCRNRREQGIVCAAA